MRTETSLDKVLESLKAQEGLVFILEDWDEGLQVVPNANFAHIEQVVTASRSKYGDRFAFRVFNISIDVWWSGEIGAICDDAPVDSQTIPVEFDWKRHPAMVRFANALCPNDEQKNLCPFQIKAVRVNGEQGMFLRFLELKREGESQS